jgi:hypothetical protein
MKTVMMTLQRDTGDHVAEWAIFHKLTGWDQIHLFDHASKPESKAVYAELLRQGILDSVTEVSWKPGDDPLMITCLNIGREIAINAEADWFVNIDDDEFLEPVFSLTVKIPLKTMPFGTIATAVHWRNYGAGEEEGLIIERCRWRAADDWGWNRFFKTIEKPQAHGRRYCNHDPGERLIDGLHVVDTVESLTGAIRGMSSPETSFPSADFLRLNHYKYRTPGEWAGRLGLDRPEYINMLRPDEHLEALQAVRDTWADRFLPELKTRLTQYESKRNQTAPF